MTYSLLIALPLLIIGLLVALAFRLRGWMWDIHREMAHLRGELRTAKQEVDTRIGTATLEMVNASCLNQLGQTFPVFLGGWSIDAFLGRWLIQHVLENRPQCIVELGSGSSTILIARALKALNEVDTTHMAVDHDAKYLDITRNLSALNDVAERIEFLHCPLEKYESLDKLWYGGLAKRLGGRKIDLLIVDGPPGPLQPMSRYPALPVLAEHLAEHCTIILDDAIRDEEQEIARRWAHENPGFELMFLPDGHGLAVLKR